LAVAHGQAADVGAEAEELTAVLAQALLPLPVEVLALALVEPVLLEVDEPLRLGGEGADVAHLGGLDVAGAGVGGQPLDQVVVVVVELGDVLDDLDVRVGLLVLLVERLEAEVAEEVDGQLDLLRGRGVGARRAAAASATAGGGEAEQRRGDQGYGDTPETRSHGSPPGLGAFERDERALSENFRPERGGLSTAVG